jgi:hypothetical protein
MGINLPGRDNKPSLLLETTMPAGCSADAGDPFRRRASGAVSEVMPLILGMRFLL